MKQGAANAATAVTGTPWPFTARMESTTNEIVVPPTRNTYPKGCIFISMTILVPVAEGSNRPRITGMQELRYEIMRQTSNSRGET